MPRLRAWIVVVPLSAALLHGASPVEAEVGDLSTALHEELVSRRVEVRGLPPDAPAWPSWTPSPSLCGPAIGDGELATAVAECGSEVAKYGQELAQILWPEGGKSSPREGFEAAAATLGLPGSAVKCLVRSRVVAQLRLTGASEAEVDAWRKRVDAAAEVVGILGALEDLAARGYEQGLRTLASTEGVDLGAKASDAEGLAKTLRDAFRSFHGARVRGFEQDLAGARARLDACDLEGATAGFESVRGELLGYLKAKRDEVAHYEQRTYCDALTRWWGEPTERIAGSPYRIPLDLVNSQQQETASSLIEMTRTIRELEGLHESKRGELDVLVKTLADIRAELAPSLRACDLARLRSMKGELQFLASQSCAVNNGWKSTIDGNIARIDRALEAVDEARFQIGASFGVPRLHLDACRPDRASRTLSEALDGLGPLLAASEVPLSACPELEPWPPEDGLTERIAALRVSMDTAAENARGLLEEAKSESASCRFDEAWRRTEAAGAAVAGTGCPLDSGACGEGSASDRRLCTLFEISQRRTEADLEIAGQLEAYEAEVGEAVRLGQELAGWGREALGRALAEEPGRCAGALEVREAARDLARLDGPERCPTPDPRVAAFVDEGRRLVEALDRHEQELRRRRDRAASAGRSAAESCDPKGLAENLAELERLDALLCGGGSQEVSELRRSLAEIERTVADAEILLREAEADLAAWTEACDPGPLTTTEAGISNLRRCGWEGLSEAQRGRVLTLEQWGDRADELQALRSRVDDLGLPLRQARTWLAAAEVRAEAGVVDAQGLTAYRDEVSRTGAYLDEARSRSTALEGEPHMSDACLWDIRTELGELEQRFRALPDLGLEESARETGAADGGWGGTVERRSPESDEPSSESPSGPCAAIGIERVLARADLALAARDLEGWLAAVLPAFRAGCRDPRLLDRLADAERLEDRSASARERDVSSAVSRGRAARQSGSGTDAGGAADWARAAGSILSALQGMRTGNGSTAPSRPTSKDPITQAVYDGIFAGGGGAAESGGSPSGTDLPGAGDASGVRPCYLKVHPQPDSAEISWWVLVIPEAPIVHVTLFDPKWDADDVAKAKRSFVPPGYTIQEKGRYSSKSAAVSRGESVKAQICGGR